MGSGQRVSSRDADCMSDFLAWHTSASESQLDIVSRLVCILEEGYVDMGPIRNKQFRQTRRQDGKTVEIYGHLLSGICLFVGVCESDDAVRTLILGPCDKNTCWDLAEKRAQFW